HCALRVAPSCRALPHPCFDFFRLPLIDRVGTCPVAKAGSWSLRQMLLHQLEEVITAHRDLKAGGRLIPVLVMDVEGLPEADDTGTPPGRPGAGEVEANPVAQPQTQLVGPCL